MSLLQVRLWQLSRLLPPRLGAHLEAHAVLPVLYASSWLLTCFAADFPLHFAGRVMDVLLTQGHQVASPLLKVGLAGGAGARAARSTGRRSRARRANQSPRPLSTPSPGCLALQQGVMDCRAPGA